MSSNICQLDLEKYILSGLYMDNEKMSEVSEIINENMFSYELTSQIYKVMFDLYSSETRIEEMLIQEGIRKAGFGTEDDLKIVSQIINGCGFIIDGNACVFFAENIADKYANTQAKMIYSEMLNKLETKMMTRKEIENSASISLSKISNITDNKGNINKCKINQKELFELIEKKATSDEIILEGLSTGSSQVDYAIDGLQKGRVYNLTADSGVGKSTWALQVALHNAMNGKVVLYGSFEMSLQEVSMRLVCMISRLSNKAISRPKEYIRFLIEKCVVKNHEEGLQYIKDKISHGKQILENLPLHIFEHPEPNRKVIANNVRKFVIQKGKIDLLVIDHTDICHNHENPVKDLYVMYKGLKDLAKYHNVPVLSLHQFNNELKNTKDRFPNVFNIRGGSGIRNNCDNIIFIYRPEIYSDLVKVEDEDEEGKFKVRGVCKFIFDKNRGCEKNEPIDMKFNGTGFYDLIETWE